MFDLAARVERLEVLIVQLGTLEFRDFSDKRRAKLADEHKAMPDGSFPIVNADDLRNAVQAAGRAKDPAAARAHIKRRAEKLGLMDQLPEDW